MEGWQCRLIQLGLKPYEEAWKLQTCLAGKIASGDHSPALLLCEHPHVITFGRRGQAVNLLWDEAELLRRGAAVHWVDRGGDVTYHGPGQLVGYPLLPLGKLNFDAEKNTGARSGAGVKVPKADYLGYVRKLEEVLIVALMKMGLVSGQLQGMTGVWIQPDVMSRCRSCPPQLRQQPAKIASIGVKIDARGVSSHGFSLNVNPDMSFWDGINACGLEGYRATSLAELLEPAPGMEETIREVCRAFEQVFGCRLAEAGIDPARNLCD